jgi:tetratricopeptide (TPR) repeat protein
MNPLHTNRKTLANGLIGLLLLVAVALLYGQFLWNPIVFDDLYFFLMDDAGHQPVSDHHFALFEVRSLPYATLAWTKAWFGLDLINFRIGNLLLHAGVVLALFFFLSNLFAQVFGEPDRDGLSPRLAAFFGALLFALHPVATYAAGYLVQRTIVMATLFGLLAMLCYVHGSVRQRPLWLWMTVPLYYLAVFSKEHAIMFPAALLAITVLLHDDWGKKLKERFAIFTCLAVIAVFVVLAKKELLGSVYEINASEMLRQNEIAIAYPLSAMTQCWLFFKYALLWIFPNPAWMSVDMREPFAQSLLSPYLVAVGCFVAWGVGACWLLLKRGRLGLVGFGLLFPWLMFLTEFSSVRIQEVFVLYRSYLWTVSAFCLLPVLFARVKVRLASFILTMIALTMFVISMERLMTFSHPMLLWDDAEKLVKNRTDLLGASRIYYNRGTEMIHIGNLDQAIADLKRSIVLDGTLAEAHGNLGAAYFQKGDWSNAITSFSAAIEIAHANGQVVSPRAIHGRAQALEKIGEWQKAQADYKESCRLAKRGCEKLLSPGQLESNSMAVVRPAIAPR